MHLYRRYWAFYWPLALTACFLLLGMQIFNAVLARYPDAERELAVFAYASSFIQFLEIAMAFMPQMVMVYGGSPNARRRVLRFCLGIGALFSCFAYLLGSTELGQQCIVMIYSIDAGLLTDISRYLLYMFPTVLLRSCFHYFGGLLTQNNKTKWVSASAFMGVGLGVVVCLYAYHAGWSALATIVSAQLSTSVGMALCAMLAYFRYYQPEDKVDFEDPRYLELFRYFWPISFTGMSFGLGRPLIYAFASRTPDALLTIAALRVALDFFMLAQAALNQFRSLLPSMGLDNLRQKKIFISLVTLVFILIMGLVVFTPLDQLVFIKVLGLNDALFERVQQTIAVVMLTPIILAVRNFLHGILLVRKKTKVIALGSACRVLTILLCCWLLLMLGWMSSWTAAMAMVVAFCIETVVVFLAAKKTGMLP